MRLNLALIGPEAVLSGGLHQGGPTGTDRAPQGWVQGAAPQDVRLQQTTTPGPLGLPGPLRCLLDPPRAVWGWVPVLPLPVPTQFPYPGSTHLARTRPMHGMDHVRDPPRMHI